MLQFLYSIFTKIDGNMSPKYGLFNFSRCHAQRKPQPKKHSNLNI